MERGTPKMYNLCMKRTIISFVTTACSLIAFGGPRISVLGDSYSTFEGYIPEGNSIWYYNPPRCRNDVRKAEDCWWSMVVTNLCGSLERNESWSGATICNRGYYGKDSTHSSFLTRVPRLGDPEVILVFGGTNDSWAHSPIGEYKYSDWTTEDCFSFRPAMAKMLDDLKKNYPRSKTYFILNTDLSNAVNQSVHEICAHYEVPCIDLHDIDKQLGHPSTAGMKAIAEQVTTVLKGAK